MGTEVHWRGKQIDTDWPEAKDWDREQIVSILNEFSELEAQPQSEQSPYKVSYFLKPNETVLRDIRKKVEVFDVDVLYSNELYLDILPRGVNKGSALTHLADTWGIDMENVIACGDSANDIAMLEVSKGVVVGNAKQELIDWANGNKTSSEVYVAQKSFAAGILEGLSHFQVAQ